MMRLRSYPIIPHIWKEIMDDSFAALTQSTSFRRMDVLLTISIVTAVL